MSEESPIMLTTNPRLSWALKGNGPDFERAVEAVGYEKTLTWLRNRVGDGVPDEFLQPAVEAWVTAGSSDDRMMARVELAEMLAEADEETSELLWEASMQDGFERNDGEQAFDAASHLAEIAEQTGDPLTAADIYIDFLNWRRAPGHAADPEFVHQAFEEVLRLAAAGGDIAAAARFGHAHAQFARVEDAGDDAATEGDWAPDAGPFTGWG